MKIVDKSVRVPFWNATLFRPLVLVSNLLALPLRLVGIKYTAKYVKGEKDGLR